MKSPRVVIIILNWNNWKDTLKCLESVNHITYPNYQVVLVDNGSVDDSVPRIREQAADDLILIENKKNLGFTGGNNVGLELALENLEPDYLLLLNNDTVVDPEFLQILVDYAEANDKGVVGPLVYHYHQPQKISFSGGWVDPCRARIKYYHLDEEDPGNLKPVEPDYISGCSLLIKKEVISRVGLLDPQFFLYNEDVDWCLRAKKAGYRISLVPSAKIWHKDSSGYSLTSLYYWGRNQYLLVKKHCPHRRYRFYVIFTLDRILLSLSLLLRGRGREAWVVLESVKDGLKNNYGYRETEL